MSFDKIFDLTAGVYFYFYNNMYLVPGTYVVRNQEQIPSRKTPTII